MQPASKLTVLLIDDDRIYQFTTKKGIQVINLSIDIISFLNGADAFDYMQKAAKGVVTVPDVIFLDINMPVMNGLEFLAAFEGIKQEFFPPVPIYIVSSSSDTNDTTNVAKYNTVKGYLVKPVQQPKFVEILKGIFEHIGEDKL